MSYGLSKKSGLWFLSKSVSGAKSQDMIFGKSLRTFEGISEEVFEGTLEGYVGNEEVFSSEEEVIYALTLQIERVISEVGLDEYAGIDEVRELLSLIERVKDSCYEE